MRGNLARLGTLDFVFYEGTSGGGFQHSYFKTPAVAADVLLLGNGRAPGAENGRPLRKIDEHIWAIDDDYLR